MKRKFLKIGAAVSALAAGFCVIGYSLKPAAESDPLVTLSYLTEIIMPQIKQDILAEVSKSYGSVFDDANQDDDSSVSGEQIQTDNSESSYTLVELTEGECLYTDSVLEFIVRPGSSVEAISPFEAQGIADITNAAEYLDGDVIPVNSYCIIPRAGDGRGIKVINEKSYILVRGEYYIG